ncbi:hypothetical protein K9B33_20985 [Sphingobium sp. 3R8]|uniref:hypothetical protein n=1 Tax=Sphingobium sp. 3R8 TaxID=2874921 RepID=UPI001CCFF20F|nr:hypothetical protein [Sphingobium sp. 3R8]MBZ9650013.1 hypothetical protein [Sphingobium sp. 3R8]
MFGLSPSDALRWVNEIRIWAMVGSAVCAVLAMGAGWAQIRLQSTVGKIKDDALDRYKADAAERTQELKTNNTKLQLELERERLERLRIEREMKPRRLSQAQAAELIALLHKIGPRQGRITSAMNDPEAHRLALDFNSVFKAAGWTNHDNCSQAMWTKPQLGLQISINPGMKQNPDAVKIASYLTSFLFDHAYTKKPVIVMTLDTEMNEFHLEVGHKI